MGLFYKPYRDGDSAHFTPLPDIGDWKFESDFGGHQFRFCNPRYEQCLVWIRRNEWKTARRTTPVEWRIMHPNGNFDTGANGKTRQFKSPERAIKALEADFDPLGA